MFGTDIAKEKETQTPFQDLFPTIWGRKKKAQGGVF